MKSKITIDLYEEEINYILTGLELFVLNLNNIWAIKKDTEEQELRYTTKMQKPKKVSKKVLNFFK